MAPSASDLLRFVDFDSEKLDRSGLRVGRRSSSSPRPAASASSSSKEEKEDCAIFAAQDLQKSGVFSAAPLVDFHTGRAAGPRAGRGDARLHRWEEKRIFGVAARLPAARPPSATPRPGGAPAVAAAAPAAPKDKAV